MPDLNIVPRGPRGRERREKDAAVQNRTPRDSWAAHWAGSARSARRHVGCCTTPRARAAVTPTSSRRDLTRGPERADRAGRARANRTGGRRGAGRRPASRGTAGAPVRRRSRFISRRARRAGHADARRLPRVERRSERRRGARGPPRRLRSAAEPDAHAGLGDVLVRGRGARAGLPRGDPVLADRDGGAGTIRRPASLDRARARSADATAAAAIRLVRSASAARRRPAELAAAGPRPSVDRVAAARGHDRAVARGGTGAARARRRHAPKRRRSPLHPGRGRERALRSVPAGDRRRKDARGGAPRALSRDASGRRAARDAAHDDDAADPRGPGGGTGRGHARRRARAAPPAARAHAERPDGERAHGAARPRRDRARARRRQAEARRATRGVAEQGDSDGDGSSLSRRLAQVGTVTDWQPLVGALPASPDGGPAPVLFGLTGHWK